MRRFPFARTVVVPILIVLVSGILALSGCVSQGGREGGRSEPAAVSESEADPGADAITRSGRASRAERIEEALLSAFRLEGRLDRMRFASREALSEYFREGFTSAFAERLASYYWMDDPSVEGSIRATEPVFREPDEIEVIDSGDARAVLELRYRERVSGPTEWPAQILEALLVREDGGWKVAQVGQFGTFTVQ